MRFKCTLALLLCFFALSLWAEEEGTPLFAGSLLSLYGQNAEPGRLAFQPYFFLVRRYGIYGNEGEIALKTNLHALQYLVSFETGITKKLDINVVFTGGYLHTHSHSAFHPGDTAILFGYQISEDNKKTPRPDLRFVFGPNLPTGKYHRLNVDSPLGDITGDGSYDMYFILVGRKALYVIPRHPMSFTVNLYYILPSTVEVQGLSVYGGGPTTFGEVHPGTQYLVNVAWEYLFSKHWGMGSDIRFEYQNRCPFKSFTPFGTPAGLPSSERWSATAFLEYNRDENFSIEAGAWWSLAGRNQIAFTSFVATVFYYF